MTSGLVLVTGANGFVGRHLCRHLADAGQRVRGSIRAGAAGTRDGVAYGVSGAINARTDWRSLLAGVESVVHTAARVHVLRDAEADPVAAFRAVNVAGTERLAEQAAESGVRRFVLLSSLKAAQAEAARRAEPEADPYARSKLEAERALARVAARHGMDYVILRPPLVYGAGAAGNFRLLVRAVALGLPLPLGSIGNRRSFIYVGNLVSAIETCLSHPEAAGRIMDVSDGPPVSTPDFVRAIARAMGRRAHLFPCPIPLLRAVAWVTGSRALLARLTGDLVAENDEIRTRLGWRAPVDTAAGLALSLVPRSTRRCRPHARRT